MLNKQNVVSDVRKALEAELAAIAEKLGPLSGEFGVTIAPPGTARPRRMPPRHPLRPALRRQ